MSKTMKLTDEELSQYEDELAKYATLDGTELGTYCLTVLDLHNRFTKYQDGKLNKQVVKEIVKRVDYYQKHAIIVEKVQQPKVIKALKWVGV